MEGPQQAEPASVVALLDRLAGNVIHVGWLEVVRDLKAAGELSISRAKRVIRVRVSVKGAVSWNVATPSLVRVVVVVAARRVALLRIAGQRCDPLRPMVVVLVLRADASIFADEWRLVEHL